LFSKQQKRNNELKKNIYFLLFVVYITIHVVYVCEYVTKKTDYLQKKKWSPNKSNLVFLFLIIFILHHDYFDKHEEYHQLELDILDIWNE
jgi:hypothetical protein